MRWDATPLHIAHLGKKAVNLVEKSGKTTRRHSNKPKKNAAKINLDAIPEATSTSTTIICRNCLSYGIPAPHDHSTIIRLPSPHPTLAGRGRFCRQVNHAYISIPISSWKRIAQNGIIESVLGQIALPSTLDVIQKCVEYKVLPNFKYQCIQCHPTIWINCGWQCQRHLHGLLRRSLPHSHYRLIVYLGTDRRR